MSAYVEACAMDSVNFYFLNGLQGMVSLAESHSFRAQVQNA